ncbi:deoxyguanosinetriphosphate triphosphohydrolase [Jatrophihabitans lederbergiae]|uniref:deoxyguanosinetriphosphate triphosphohydrolase n=1 Tax=Jatrophihabitans lederbergiae TaxID=3075547 RepID=UPI0037C10046
MRTSRFGRFRYDDLDQARWLVESPKRGQVGADYPDKRNADERGPFERDRARVLHSYAFRRLADKTQVVSPGQDDFPRTRLTHSLEVAQIGREMGAELGCDPDITDAAGLAHDLGHPPFGHNGEDALNSAAAGAGGFEGNAQTLRILTRLEAKTVSDDGRSAGLNLTRATLDAVCKYPWAAREGTRKFGVYGSDLQAFEWLRDGREPGRRCLEAQVMDWADDVAYSVHDVEDGVHAGHIRLADLDDSDERQALCEQAAEFYSARPAAELAPMLEGLLRLEPLRDLAGYDGSFRAQAAAKRATSELTGRFVGAAVGATRAAFGDPPFGRYRTDLVVPAEVAAECALLKAIALRYVMRRAGVETVLFRQRVILLELVEELLRLGERGLSLAQRDSWRAAADDAERLRVVIDQVAQLTDSSALAWHERLCTARGR